MRIRLRLFGYTVASLTVDSGQPLVEEPEDPQGITGGSSLYTERDMCPPSNEEPYYEDRRFGAHVVSDSSWTVNINTATISPSVLVHSHKTLIDSTLEGDALTAPENITETPQCHSFVTDGRIQFLGDCTHSLAGQTVELPEWEEAA